MLIVEPLKALASVAAMILPSGGNSRGKIPPEKSKKQVLGNWYL
jgi:hypothetical protein